MWYFCQFTAALFAEFGASTEMRDHRSLMESIFRENLMNKDAKVRTQLMVAFGTMGC